MVALIYLMKCSPSKSASISKYNVIFIQDFFQVNQNAMR